MEFVLVMCSMLHELVASRDLVLEKQYDSVVFATPRLRLILVLGIHVIA